MYIRVQMTICDENEDFRLTRDDYAKKGSLLSFFETVSHISICGFCQGTQSDGGLRKLEIHVLIYQALGPW